MFFMDVVSEMLTKTPDAIDFCPAIEASFAINLAYTILFKFGKFSGVSLDLWANREQLRVIPAMAETPTFNEPKFQNGLHPVPKTPS
jgi:hypothetical protein